MGDATDFGDMTRTTSYDMFSASTCVRGTFGAGGFPSSSSEIEYITIPTKGDSVDFGGLTHSDALIMLGNCSNAHGGL